MSEIERAPRDPESLELRSRNLRVAATGRFGVLAVAVIFISVAVAAALVR